jgi:hypothetical protein
MNKKTKIKHSDLSQTSTRPNSSTVSEGEIKTIEKVETRINFVEAGTLGIQQYSGFIHEAYNTQLQWPQCAPLYQRIRRSTPEIVSIVRAFTAWARNVNIDVDLPADASSDDKKYKEFLLSVFEDMEGGPTKFIETMVSRVPFDGWGWWEAVPCKRDAKWKPPAGSDPWTSQYDDGLMGFRKLAYRDSSSFFEWIFNNNKTMIAMSQVDSPLPKVILPLKNSLHLTFGDSTNPEGLSPLESVWRLERLKYGFEVVMGIGFEHAAGFLSVNKTETGALSADDKANVKSAARAILTAQEGNYALWPFGITGQVIDATFSAAPSLLETIKYYSTMMYMVYLMNFMALNTLTGTGALASATDASDISVFSFNSMMDGFADQVDAQIGKRLYAWNKDAFPGITQRPKIKFTHIDKTAVLSEMSSFVAQLNGMMPFGEEDWKAIREKSGFLPKNMPPKTPEQLRAERYEKLFGGGFAEDQSAPQDSATETPAEAPGSPPTETAFSSITRVRAELNKFRNRMTGE